MNINKNLKYKGNTEQINKVVGITLQGLVSTSIDVVDEFGWEDSKETVNKLSDAAFEIIEYWGLDEEVYEEYANIVDELKMGSPVDPLIVVELLNLLN